MSSGSLWREREHCPRASRSALIFLFSLLHTETLFLSTTAGPSCSKSLVPFAQQLVVPPPHHRALEPFRGSSLRSALLGGGRRCSSRGPPFIAGTGRSVSLQGAPVLLGPSTVVGSEQAPAWPLSPALNQGPDRPFGFAEATSPADQPGPRLGLSMSRVAPRADRLGTGLGVGSLGRGNSSQLKLPGGAIGVGKAGNPGAWWRSA